jgi:hypothetical protein
MDKINKVTDRVRDRVRIEIRDRGGVRDRIRVIDPIWEVLPIGCHMHYIRINQN